MDIIVIALKVVMVLMGIMMVVCAYAIIVDLRDARRERDLELQQKTEDRRIKR